MKKDWSAIHKLIDALKDVKDTEDVHVHISIHRLSDADIDSVMKRIPAGYEKKEEVSGDGSTGWTSAITEFNKFGFKCISLTLFFRAYSIEKYGIRVKEKGGDINC